MAIQDVDAAIEYVNARPTPLALYVFSEKRKDFEYGPLPLHLIAINPIMRC